LAWLELQLAVAETPAGAASINRRPSSNFSGERDSIWLSLQRCLDFVSLSWAACRSALKASILIGHLLHCCGVIAGAARRLQRRPGLHQHRIPSCRLRERVSCCSDWSPDHSAADKSVRASSKTNRRVLPPAYQIAALRVMV